MEFFNKLGKKASETYKVTAEKTGKLAKEAKLRMKMNENKSDIDDLYKQIGKKVYEKHVKNEELNKKEELEEECTKIDVLSDEIEDILKEILILKDMKQCPNCNTKVEKSAKYCSNCGAEQEIPQEEPEEAEVVEEKENVEENKEDNSEPEVIEAEVVEEEKKEDNI